MMGTVSWFSRVWLLVMLLMAEIALSLTEASAIEPGNTVGNAACPREEVFFDPGRGEDIFVPSGFRSRSSLRG